MFKNLLLLTTTLLLCMHLSAQTVLRVAPGGKITLNSNASIYVGGGIMLDSQSLLNHSGTITIARTGTGTADFIDSTQIASAYHYGNGTILFTGSGTQQISSPNRFGQINIDNSGLNLGTDIGAEAWHLKSGVVNTGVFTAIAHSTAGTSVQADGSNPDFTNAWFNGSLRRYLAPAAVNQYQFPVGNASRVNRVELDNLQANPLTGLSYITVAFGPKPGTDAGLSVIEASSTYNAVNNGGVWYLAPDANPGGGSFDLKLYFNGFTGLADNAFGILGRPTVSANATDWVLPENGTLPTAGNPGRTVISGFSRRNGITNFNGQYGIGMVLTALPLNLLVFTGERQQQDILLSWQANRQVNTDRFEIFKGSRPDNLQYLTQLAAAGNSGAAVDRYDLLDQQPFTGANYYRLKMVDRDNSFSWSQVIRIDMNRQQRIQVFPNPVSKSDEIYLQTDAIHVKAISLFSVEGRAIANNLSMVAQGRLLRVLLPPTLAKGIYTLRMQTDLGVKTEQLMVQ